MGSEGKEPRVIGRYELHGEIAAGGMATVHFGRLSGPVGFSRTVAIKRLHPQFAKDPEFVTMFLDEARLAARIRHPNVVPTLDVVATDGEIFLVMEYVQGESLSRLNRTLRASGSRVPPRVAAAILSNVLHGLHAAHEAKDERGRPLNIVHRDVSPQNVLVGIDGIARVLDFGVAKAAGRLQTTREGQIKGKIAYMAPEQLSGAASISRQSDIYAASVVLWEALCGRRLFDGDNEAIVLARALEGRVEPPTKYTPGLPPELDEILFRGLHRDASKRFQTAREMAIALERSLGMAAPSEVGEWVETTAGDVLHQRAARIAEIESVSSSQHSAQSIMADIASSRQLPSTEPSSAPTPVTTSSKRIATAVGGPAISSKPGARAEPESQLSSISVSRSGDIPFRLPKRRAPALLLALGGGGLLLVIVLVATIAALRTPTTTGPETTTGTAPPPPAAEPTDTAAAKASAPDTASPEPPAVSPPTTIAQTATTTKKPVAASPPAATIKKTATPPPTVIATATATQTGTKKDCEPPYTIDKDGHKVWKKHCLQ